MGTVNDFLVLVFLESRSSGWPQFYYVAKTDFQLLRFLPLPLEC